MQVYKFVRGKNKGFSLVELLIVVAILAILSGILVPSLIRYVEKARKHRVFLEAKALYDYCMNSVAEVDGVTYMGKKTNLHGTELTIADGMNKTDPVYGKCGRISNLSCYQVFNKKLTDVDDLSSYVDQYIAQGIVEGLTEFSQDNYGSASPNGMNMNQILADSKYSGKFCFICCYNEHGCIYVEVYHRGYFVHFEKGKTSVDDVINVRNDPEGVSFSDVHK